MFTMFSLVSYDHSNFAVTFTNKDAHAQLIKTKLYYKTF